MKNIRWGINAEAPVEEIVAVLAKYGITISLIDHVFDRAKARAISCAIVTKERITSEQGHISSREKLLKKTLGVNTFDEIVKDVRVVLRNYNLDVRPQITQDLIAHVLSGDQREK